VEYGDSAAKSTIFAPVVSVYSVEKTGVQYSPVQHIVLLIYFLLLSAGFAGLTVTIILWRRLRVSVLGWIVAVILSFTVWLLLALIAYYIESIVLVPVSFSPFLNVSGTILGFAFYVFMMICVFLVRPSSRVAPLLFSAPLLGAYVYAFLAATAFPGLLHSSAAREIFSFASMAAGSLFVGYSGYAFLLGGRKLKQETVGFLLRGLGKMMLVFAPTAVISSGVLWLLGVSFDPTVPLNFVLFFCWNVLAIVSFLRYLVRPTALLEEGRVSSGFSKEYGISPREVEVVELISHGMSNKEIANYLHVSFTTARTHVYNIFKKTGARSRVELLRIVSGYRE